MGIETGSGPGPGLGHSLKFGSSTFEIGTSNLPTNYGSAIERMFVDPSGTRDAHAIFGKFSGFCLKLRPEEGFTLLPAFWEILDPPLA